MRKKITAILAPISATMFSFATISALAGMAGTTGQLRFHLGAAMNTGLTEAQMKDFISVLKSEIGKKEAESAYEVLVEVLSNRAK